MPGFSVDAHPQKSKIVEGILAGKSVRDIAAGVSPRIAYCAVQRYKVNVIKPILTRAEESSRVLNINLGTKQAPVALTTDTQVQQVTQNAAMDRPTLSIFRQRLENLHGRIDRSLDKAENAVRVIRDKKGEIKHITEDLSPIAPLVSQAHKNLELLGRATGELEPENGSGSVSIQIVCPQSPENAMPRITYASSDQIELTGGDDIGLLQK